MIKLDVIGNNPQHFVVRADVPVRIEVVLSEQGLLAFVYEGVDDSPEQDPVGAYDGTLENPADAQPPVNRSWEAE